MTNSTEPLLLLNYIPGVDPNHPEGKQWRNTVESIVLGTLLHSRPELLAVAVDDLHPTYFDGDHRTICEALIRLYRAGAVITPDTLREEVGGAVDADVLGAVLAPSRGAPDSVEWPLWIERESLNDFLRELRRVETALYFWFDAEDRLLYIGITGDLAVRQTSHAKRSTWAQFAARAEVVRYPSRTEAEVAEKAAIESERPLFNHVHNDSPEARAHLVRYLIDRGRADLLAPAVSRG